MSEFVQLEDLHFPPIRPAVPRGCAVQASASERNPRLGAGGLSPRENTAFLARVSGSGCGTISCTCEKVTPEVCESHRSGFEEVDSS